jgi:hypothetical protein
LQNLIFKIEFSNIKKEVDLKMFELRVAEHLSKPGVETFEMWDKGRFMAVIYPTETGVKIVSKYLPLNPEEALNSIKIDCNEFPTAISVNLSLE